jgi:hypothetical protein
MVSNIILIGDIFSCRGGLDDVEIADAHAPPILGFFLAERSLLLLPSSFFDHDTVLVEYGLLLLGLVASVSPSTASPSGASPPRVMVEEQRGLSLGLLNKRAPPCSAAPCLRVSSMAGMVEAPPLLRYGNGASVEN